MAKVLIVEDEEPLRRMVSDWLKRQHYDAEAVGDGKAAIACLDVSEYDLVAMDLGLPRKLGHLLF